ncbi:uncharacterized protein TNCV_79591 [Trichonephila clavipes]|nr:uncharacterized protein TNCV_79591 [Trichonephila clavipes]
MVGNLRPSLSCLGLPKAEPLIAFMNDEAVGSLVVRASDFRPEGLGSMPDATKYPPSTHGFPCRNCGGGDRWCRHLTSLRGISPSQIVLSPVWCSRPTTGVPLAPCHDEFRGPRSDYVRQLALETTTMNDELKLSRNEHKLECFDC